MSTTFTVPGEVAAAISAARPELLKIAPRRAMSADEVAGLYEVMAELIRIGFKSQQEVTRLRKALKTLRDEALEAKMAAQEAVSRMLQMLKETEAEDEDQC
jgi:multidrug resistance efflux pump